MRRAWILLVAALALVGLTALPSGAPSRQPGTVVIEQSALDTHLAFLAGTTISAGASTSVNATNPPVVANAAACQKANAASPSTQPYEIVIVGKRGAQRDADRYFTRFVELNKDCVPSGFYSPNTSSNTNWLTFAPNVTADRASKIAQVLRTTGLFARVTVEIVPHCNAPGFTLGSCTPPTSP